MSVGGVSGSSGAEIASLNSQMVELTAEYNDVQKKLMSPPGFFTQDQIESYARSAQAIGLKIFGLAKHIQAVLSSQPSLPPPQAQSLADVGTNVAAMRTNGWLAPNALVAFIVALNHFLKSEQRNSAIEGQNAVQGMLMTNELGKQEAALQRKQGELEYRKAWISAGVEMAGALMTFATVAKRTHSMSKSSLSGKAKEIGKENDATQARNNKIIADKTAENARLRARLNGDQEEGTAQVSGQPLPPKAPLPPNSPQAQEANRRIAANEQEIAAAKESNLRSKENFEYQKQEMLRQELVTWDQIGRGVDHLSNSAAKINEGIFAKQIKEVEAQLALVRSYSDILKTYMQSTNAAAADSRQQATDSARAMSDLFQAHTRSYWNQAA